MTRTKKHDDLMKLIDKYAVAEVAVEIKLEQQTDRDDIRAAMQRAKDAREAVVKYLDENFRAWSTPDLD